MNRLDALLRLVPRRFHISSNPPFGLGLVISGEITIDDEFDESDGIKNCKPGIWTSVRRNGRHVGLPHMDFSKEFILYWVEAGTFDISQSVADWHAYENATRHMDEEKADAQLAKFEWIPYSSHCSDDGICAVISTEYLTQEAARRVQFGSDNTAGSDDPEDYSFYLDMVSRNVLESPIRSEGFTIGGLSCMYVVALVLCIMVELIFL
jgi:hypothetical protein